MSELTIQYDKSQNRLSNPLDSKTQQRLKRNISAGLPFYVRMQISSLEAQAAMLLHWIVNGKRANEVSYHAFFCSGTSEAISGALKVVRHNLHVHHPDRAHEMAVFDPGFLLRQMFDPLSAGGDDALVPGFVYFDDFESFDRYVASSRPSGILIRRGQEIPLARLSDLLNRAQEQHIYSILDESSTDLSKHAPLAAQLSTLPDVITMGENTTDHRVPAGCFLMSQDIYQIWNHSKNYNLHSNTWGGNSASMSAMLDFLLASPAGKSLTQARVSALQEAADSHAAATRMYAEHCSAMMAKMLGIGGLNKCICSAHGAKIQIRTPAGVESVIDASGTYGVNLWGHNPQEIVESVLDQHDPEHDYWQDLKACLHAKTGMAEVVPAVSGATAGEAALTFALLAAAPRKRIVTLAGGFLGKTLIALNGTPREKYQAAFGPLYQHTSTVDPFSEHGTRQLEALLAQGDVGLVILEAIQGDGGVRTCPQSFLDFLSQQKKQHDFLVAVDEVQTGMYRTGEFLYHRNKLADADIVLMGKALSGNVFPVSATLLSQTVLDRAMQTNPTLVERYQQMYRCQFAAQVALQMIQLGDDLDLGGRACELGQYFIDQLRHATGDMPWVKEVRGTGMMIGIEFNPDRLPRLVRQTYGGLIASHCINNPQQRVLVAYTPDKPFMIRLLPPLCITREQLDAITVTLGKALRSGVLGLLKPVIVNTLNAKRGKF